MDANQNQFGNFNLPPQNPPAGESQTITQNDVGDAGSVLGINEGAPQGSTPDAPPAGQGAGAIGTTQTQPKGELDGITPPPPIKETPEVEEAPVNDTVVTHINCCGSFTLPEDTQVRLKNGTQGELITCPMCGKVETLENFVWKGTDKNLLEHARG